MDNNDSFKTTPPVSLSSATPTTEQLLPNEATVFSNMDVQSSSMIANMAKINGNTTTSSSSYENHHHHHHHGDGSVGLAEQQSFVTDVLDHQEFDSEIEFKTDATQNVEDLLDEIPRLCQAASAASMDGCASEDDDSFSDDSDTHSVIYVPTSLVANISTTPTSPFTISPIKSCGHINGAGNGGDDKNNNDDDDNDDNGHGGSFLDRTVKIYPNEDDYVDEEEIYYQQNNETLKQKKSHSHLLTDSQAILNKIIQQKNADNGIDGDGTSSSMLHDNDNINDNDMIDNGHTKSILTNINNSKNDRFKSEPSSLKNLLTTFTINHSDPVEQQQQQQQQQPFYSDKFFKDSPFEHQYKFVDINPSDDIEETRNNTKKASTRGDYDEDYDDDDDDDEDQDDAYDRCFRPSNSNVASKHNLGTYFIFSHKNKKDSNNVLHQAIGRNRSKNNNNNNNNKANVTTSFGSSCYTFEPDNDMNNMGGSNNNNQSGGGGGSFFRHFYQQPQQQQNNNANDVIKFESLGSDSLSLSSTPTSTMSMHTVAETIPTTKINDADSAISMMNIADLNSLESSLFSSFDPLRDMTEMETSLIENNNNNSNLTLNNNNNNTMQQHQILMQQQQQHHYAITPNVVIVGNNSNHNNNNNNNNRHSHHHPPLNGVIKPLTTLGGEGQPYVMLTRKENSCPFMDRRISLMKDCKIGRSIGKTRPSADNAVFDCKVLSRNHALLWYQDGKFYLKDNCSSNGTFVNNQRLSTANEKSSPHVLYSGDIIQFGVEVTEKKNVHSCVIATIRLFHPDGSEARKDYSSLRNGLAMDVFDEHHFQNFPDTSINISPSQLVDLSFYLKESVRKQALLESQLDSMKQVVKEALNHAKYGWNSLVDEDLLMSRIQTLESQLEVCLIVKNKDQRPVDELLEALKQETLKLIDDKEKFERASKRSIQRALEEKNTIENSLQTAQSELNAKIEECNVLKESLDLNAKEMKMLANNCDKLKNENDELQAKINNKMVNGGDSMMAKFLSANIPDSVWSMQTSKIDQEVQTVAIAEFRSPESSPCFWDARDNSQDKETQTIGEQQPKSIEKSFTEVYSEKDFDNDSLASFQVKNFQEYMEKLATENVEFGERCLTALANIMEMLEQKSNKLVKIQKNFQNIMMIVSQMAISIDREKAENRDLNQKIEDLQRKLYEQTEECNKFECDMDIMNEKIIEYKLMENEFAAKKPQHQPLKDVTIQTDADNNNDDDFDGPKQPNIDEKEKVIPKTPKIVSETSELVVVKQCEQCSVLEQVLKTIDMIKLDDQTYLKNNGNINHNQESLAASDDHGIKQHDDVSDGLTEICENDQHSKLNKELTVKLKEFGELNHRILVLNENLENEIKNLKHKYAWLSQQNEVSFCIAVLPLFIILIAIILALYSPLSYITGTFGL